MQSSRGLLAIKRLVQSEPELLALSERLASSALASTATPSAAAIVRLSRSDAAALTRLAPRLIGTLAAVARGGNGLPRAGSAALLLRRELQQVFPSALWGTAVCLGVGRCHSRRTRLVTQG